MPGTRIGRGAADGVAPLDAASKLPRSHLPDATAAEAGAVRLATDAEVENASGTGTLQTRQLARRTATQNRAGLVELSTDAETITGTDTGRAVTPKNLKAALTSLTGGVTEIRVSTADSYTGNGAKIAFDRCSLAVATEDGVATITLTNNFTRSSSGRPSS